jgi:hypothetical protein
MGRDIAHRSGSQRLLRPPACGAVLPMCELAVPAAPSFSGDLAGKAPATSAASLEALLSTSPPLSGGIDVGCCQAGLKSKASFQRTKRPREGEGKCAVHMMVELSQRRPNSSRRDCPACVES